MQLANVFGYWWKKTENNDWIALINFFDCHTKTKVSFPLKAKKENLEDRDFPKRIGLVIQPAA